MLCFKQALNQFGSQWKTSLLLGMLATLMVGTVLHLTDYSIFIAFFGAFAFGLGLLICQRAADKSMDPTLALSSVWPPRQHLLSYAIIALFLVPTGAVTAIGVSFFLVPGIPLILFLGVYTVCVYFFLILSQTLRFHLEKNQPLAKAGDTVGLLSLRKIPLYSLLSFIFAVLFLISGMTKGAGLLVTLPLLFYTNYFLYQKLFATPAAKNN
ncbi:MAG: hypothetical protein AAGB31_00570 [Bdellovibrio sp.]